MNDTPTTILYALSTIAQTCAALAAFVGAVGIFRLQRLLEQQVRLENTLRAARFEITRDPAPVTMTTIMAWVQRVEATPQSSDATSRVFQSIVVPAFAAWRAVPGEVSASRRALIVFETWNLIVIGVTLIAFSFVSTLAACPRLSTVLLYFIAAGTVATTFRCVVVWTR